MLLFYSRKVHILHIYCDKLHWPAIADARHATITFQKQLAKIYFKNQQMVTMNETNIHYKTVRTGVTQYDSVISCLYYERLASMPIFYHSYFVHICIQHMYGFYLRNRNLVLHNTHITKACYYLLDIC